MNPRTILYCVSALAISVASASAQSTDRYSTSFSAGYDLIYQERSDVSNVGIHVDAATTVKDDLPLVSVVGEAGLNHFNNANIGSITGGGRVRIPVSDERFVPFGQLLVGLYRCGQCHQNDFALQIGGGIDFRIPDHDFRVRVQLDVRHVFPESVGFDALRISGGLVLPLKR